MEGSYEQKRRFCAAYLRTMDPVRAAREAGLRDGIAALEEPVVQRQLARMRRVTEGQILREDAVRRLCELAFGRANDAVALAMEPGRRVEELDLAAVAEWRSKADGTVEIKFIDRVKALEALCNQLESGEGDGAEKLFRALEEAGAEE